MPYFFNYYRGLGFDHFIIIDNESTDDIMSTVENRSDVTLFLAHGSYKDSHFGIDWQNHLLWRYCCGKWACIVDPDELLVYPYCDSRDVKELTAYMKEIGRHSLPCLLVDMYAGQGPVSGWICAPGQNPLEVCQFFDSVGFRDQDTDSRGKWIQGGPRMRLYFRDAPEKSPALNKFPLVYWKAENALKSSTHTLWPRRLNRWHGREPATTGALLHFKFLSTFTTKAEEEEVRKQHFSGGAEYARYHSGRDDATFLCEASRRFESWRDLEACGLISRGYWF